MGWGANQQEIEGPHDFCTLLSGEPALLPSLLQTHALCSRPRQRMIRVTPAPPPPLSHSGKGLTGAEHGIRVRERHTHIFKDMINKLPLMFNSKPPCCLQRTPRRGYLSIKTVPRGFCPLPWGFPVFTPPLPQLPPQTSLNLLYFWNTGCLCKMVSRLSP